MFGDYVYILCIVNRRSCSKLSNDLLLAKFECLKLWESLIQKWLGFKFFYSITTLFLLSAVNGPGAGEFDGPN
jgi:hypothetical protein